MPQPHNKPTQSIELQLLNSLDLRMKFSPSVKQHYDNLLKGYMGELKFYELLRTLSMDCIVLYDLLLPSDQTTFQIDSLLIYQDKMILFEIKNFEGDFYIQEDNWYIAATNREINNPLHQLKRSKFLLLKTLRKLGFHYSVFPYVVFVNESFTLYQAPLKLPVIFPTQIERFIDRLNNQSSRTTDKHRSFASQVIDMQTKEHHLKKTPVYDFHQIRKGIKYAACNKFLTYYNHEKLVCTSCGIKEDLDSAVLRNIDTFHLLFPDKRITTTKIYEWCEIIKSKKTIRRILMKHLKLIRNGKYSYYVFK